MAAQVVTNWNPARAIAARDDTDASCPLDDAAEMSPARALTAAGLILAVAVLVLAPTLVALASLAAPSTLAGAQAWVQRIPPALAFVISWRVPACILIALALARTRRLR